MIRIRRSDERGHANHGWLDTYHTFSFAGYHDPRNMGFRSLRVLNDDKVAPAAGFPTHPHRDMEILTYVVEGALEHRDSSGGGSVIRPGDVQRMTAGSGIAHSEFNPSSEEWTRLLQIWLLPERRGLEPGYEQKHFEQAGRRGKLRLVASRDGRDGSLTIHQDVAVYAGLLAAGDRARLPLAPGRHAWVQVVRGAVGLGERVLGEGDGAAISDEPAVELTGGGDQGGEVLLFDLA